MELQTFTIIPARQHIGRESRNRGTAMSSIPQDNLSPLPPRICGMNITIACRLKRGLVASPAIGYPRSGDSPAPYPPAASDASTDTGLRLAHSVPARKEPGTLTQVENEPRSFPFDYCTHDVPADVATPQGAPPGVAVVLDDPLFTVLIFKISRILGRVGLDTWWLATSGRVDVVGVEDER